MACQLTAPVQVIAANPETWVTHDRSPFFLAHAPADPIVPVQHSIFLSDRITQIAGPGRATLRLVEGAGHAAHEFDAPKMIAEFEKFLSSALKTGS